MAFQRLGHADIISETYDRINDNFDQVEHDTTQHKTAETLDHPDGSVKTAKVADKAITRAKIGDKAVGTGQIGDKAVGAAQLADGAVGSGQLSPGSATDTVIGDRAISDSAAPTGNAGTLTVLFGWLGYMIKAITGKSNWRTAPATTLEAAKEHADDTTRHITVPERTAWNGKVDKVTGKQLSTEDYTANEKAKLAGVAAGAEVNQNAFATVRVAGQSDVAAGAKSATLTLKNGTGIMFTTNPATGEVTATATGEATPGAHGSSHNSDGSDPIPELMALEAKVKDLEDFLAYMPIDGGTFSGGSSGLVVDGGLY